MDIETYEKHEQDRAKLERKVREDELVGPFLRPLRVFWQIAYATVAISFVAYQMTLPDDYGPNVSKVLTKQIRDGISNRYWIEIGAILALLIAGLIGERMLRRQVLARFAENPDTVTKSAA